MHGGTSQEQTATHTSLGSKLKGQLGNSEQVLLHAYPVEERLARGRGHHVIRSGRRASMSCDFEGFLI